MVANEMVADQFHARLLGSLDGVMWRPFDAWFRGQRSLAGGWGEGALMGWRVSMRLCWGFKGLFPGVEEDSERL